MTSRESRYQLDSIVIPIETDLFSSVQGRLPEDRTEKECVKTIFNKLKKIARSCYQEERWTKFKVEFETLKSNKNKKEIIEKLDEENSYALIHYAVLYNNKFVIETLLSEGFQCDVNLRGSDGQTPLHLAACSSAIEKELNDDHQKTDSILSILLKQLEIGINVQDDKDRTPLHHAIMRNHGAIVAILLKSDADFKIGDIQGATPIHYAYRFAAKDSDILKRISSKPQYELLKTKDGKTPMDLAIAYGCFDNIKGYLQKQASINEIIEAVKVAIPILYSCPSMAGLIARIISKFDKKEKLYMLQCICRHPDGHTVFTRYNIGLHKELLSEACSPDGFTPLMIAVKFQRKKCVKHLLKEYFFDQCILKNRSTDLEQTVLHICAEYPNNSITDMLLNAAKTYKLDLEARDIFGNTPLHICAEKNNGNTYMCKKLLPHVNEKAESSKKNFEYLTKRNNAGFTAFHLATEKEHNEMVKHMVGAVPGHKSSIIKFRDQQLRTSLHIAALNGNVELVRLFRKFYKHINCRDINDHTPLHNAVHWSDSGDDNNQNRKECIKILIKAGADINALNIHRESPLHVACRYGSSDLVETLLNSNAKYLLTNVQGYNCFEVAIEEKNKEVVEYLINDKRLFKLMRNAQISERRLEPCCSFGSDRCRTHCCIPCCNGFESCLSKTWRAGLDNYCADTPMRKLIINMPDMAFEVLDRCTITVGSKQSKVHQKSYNYEFLEDQYTVRRWAQGNINSSSSTRCIENEPYSYDCKVLVMRHPLFLMAVHNQYKLMAHPLSRRLVNNKFYHYGVWLFLILCLSYATFLGLYTTMVLITTHPEVYYNLAGFNLTLGVCYNVTQAFLTNNTLASYKDPFKNKNDTILRAILYLTIVSTGLKILWHFFLFLRIDWPKMLAFLPESIAVGCCTYFIYDNDYQQKFRMRCLAQWNVGAYGLFIGYMALFHYIQYSPGIGIYVIMLKQILIRFLLFMPVLTVLICGFTLTLYMTFPNFEAFKDFGFGLAKTIIMSTGELNYDDFMHNENTPAFYHVGHIVLVFFTIAMPVLATNLLIGLAVGEIAPMMLKAKQSRLDMFFELTADLEIFKHQIVFWLNRCCKLHFPPAEYYTKRDQTKKLKWWKAFKKRCLKICTREVDGDSITHEFEDAKDKYDYSKILQEIKNKIKSQPTETPNRPKNKIVMKQGPYGNKLIIKK